jgi:hypothetical protein
VTIIPVNRIIYPVVIGTVPVTKMSTITLNVGGKEFTISKAHVYKSARLTNLLAFESSDAHFLDYNYDAFAVVLDFLRHDRILVPATVNSKTVELILDDLEVKLSLEDREALSTNHGTSSDTEFPPQYSSTVNEKYLLANKTDQLDTSSLVDQLAITVHQKIADLIISTIRPRIATQALQGAYRTTYVLLPSDVKNEVLMSEFPNSTFTEMVYLEKEVEKFLGQPEVLRRFEFALKESVEVPMKFKRQEVFFRSENEFGIYGTMNTQALVIEFELGRQL